MFHEEHDRESLFNIWLTQLTLEWATLSKYTGNSTYRALAEKSVKHIANLVCKYIRFDFGQCLTAMLQPSPLPGLAAQGIDPATGESRSIVLCPPAY